MRYGAGTSQMLWNFLVNERRGLDDYQKTIKVLSEDKEHQDIYKPIIALLERIVRDKQKHEKWLSQMIW